MTDLSVEERRARADAFRRRLGLVLAPLLFLILLVAPLGLEPAAHRLAAIVALALALPMLTMTAIVGAAAPESIFTAEAAPSPALREATAVWSRDPLRFVVAVELCIALTLGYVAGLLRGGFAVIQHGVLRFLLRGRLPLGLVALLEAASERALLQRIGGGYRFVHAGLREHLAGEAARSGA